MGAVLLTQEGTDPLKLDFLPPIPKPKVNRSTCVVSIPQSYPEDLRVCSDQDGCVFLPSGETQATLSQCDVTTQVRYTHRGIYIPRLFGEKFTTEGSTYPTIPTPNIQCTVEDCLLTIPHLYPVALMVEYQLLLECPATKFRTFLRPSHKHGWRAIIDSDVVFSRRRISLTRIPRRCTITPIVIGDLSKWVLPDLYYNGGHDD